LRVTVIGKGRWSLCPGEGRRASRRFVIVIKGGGHLARKRKPKKGKRAVHQTKKKKVFRSHIDLKAKGKEKGSSGLPWFTGNILARKNIVSTFFKREEKEKRFLEIGSLWTNRRGVHSQTPGGKREESVPVSGCSPKEGRNFK